MTMDSTVKRAPLAAVTMRETISNVYVGLSPSYQRESAYIAIHMYKGMEYSDYFQAVEKLFQAYDGRPHWGKMHNMKYDKLKEHYPKLKDFLQIRKELDPKGLFLNSYLKKLFQL